MKTALTWVAIVVIIVLGIFFLAKSSDDSPADDTSETLKAFVVTLAEQNESGVTGQVTLTDEEGGLKVVVSLGDDAGVRPAHIHAGTCDDLDGVTFPLTNVEGGESITLLETTLEDLSSLMPWAINLHEGADNIQNYIACGNGSEVAEAEKEEGASMKVPAPGNEGVEEMVVEEGEEDAPGEVMTDTRKVFVVNYTNSGFTPKDLEIKLGDTVKFINNSGGEMWVASANHPTHRNYPEKSGDDCLGSSFDQCANGSAGSSWEFTFNVVGGHSYHNHVRASAWGRVVVK